MEKHEHTKAVLNRMARASGHLNAIKKMIEDDRYCDEILTQLLAVDKAVKSLSSIILEKHMYSCIKKEVSCGNLEIVDEMMQLFRRYSS